MKIQITGDSTLDLTKELYDKYDIAVTPFVVTLGDETFLDGVNIAPADIYDYVKKTGKLPTTAAKSPEDLREFFEKYTNEGYEVIHIGIGAELSSGYGYACIAAKDNPHVHIVDTRTLSSGSGMLAIYASELAKSGNFTAEEIAKRVRKRAHYLQSSFVIENLKFLHKGGRCSMISMLGANLMRIKPCIEVVNGKNKVTRKYVGNMPACIEKYIAETIGMYNNIDFSRCIITYSTATPEMLNCAKNALAKYGKFREIITTQAGSVINCHCGQNTLGIFFFYDKDIDH